MKLAIEETWLIDAVGFGIGGLEEKKLAIDVGANKGDWTVELAKVFKSVIAIEPDQRNPLASSVESLENVSVVWAAAWKADGEVVLHERESPDQNSLLEAHPIGAGGGAPAPSIAKRTVRSVSLTSVAPDGADLVKIDIEGAEAEVLSACDSGSGIWDRTLFIVECHDTYPAVEAELKRLGKVVQMIPHPSSTAHSGHVWAVGGPE